MKEKKLSFNAEMGLNMIKEFVIYESKMNKDVCTKKNRVQNIRDKKK